MTLGWRDHLFRIRKEILFEPLNKGRRLHYLGQYLRWQGKAKYGSDKWVVTFENGFRSYVHPYPDHDAGERNIWTRNVDWHDNELVRRVLRRGDVIVDAGCNVGNRTWALADLLSGALLIDAGATAVARTAENRALNGLPPDRFVIMHKAVGAEPGVVTFSDLGGASTLNRVLEPGAQPQGRTVQVEMTTIDAEVQRLGLKPSFIKVDVEGQDLNALRGALGTLQSGSVRLVKFEHDERLPVQPLLDLFASIGWAVFTLDRYGRISQDAKLLASNMNLLAAPPHVLEELKRG